MKKYYCINLRFKKTEISTKIFHSHLYVSDKEMFFQIFDKDLTSQIDRKFMSLDSSIGMFKDNFDIEKSEIGLMLDKSEIYRISSFKTESQHHYFTVYVSKIGIILPNKSKEFIREGSAYLNCNGLKVVNTFYSFFSNWDEKNEFSISRMEGMADYYKAADISFRPELEFQNNERRGSKKFTIKKIPTLHYRFQNSIFQEAQRTIKIICKFLSFCYGIRILCEKLVYRTEDEIVVFRDTSPNKKTFVSNFSSIFYHLERNYDITKILNTDWYTNYKKKERQMDKVIDNYLHSREVDLTASFLLLFNIIEVFSTQKNEKFEFDNLKEKRFNEAFDVISKSLAHKQEKYLLKDKWDGIISKIEFKPMKSPLEETLRINNIESKDFGYSFGRLKKTRDRLTHGSVDSVKEIRLQSQTYCLKNIATRLILAELGLKDDFRKPYII